MRRNFVKRRKGRNVMLYRSLLTRMLVLATALLLMAPLSGRASETKGAEAIERISPEEARSKVLGGEALLVCAYGDKKCASRLLEGALLRSAFERRLSTLSKSQMIVFYCA